MIRKNYSENRFRSLARIAKSRRLPDDFFHSQNAVHRNAGDVMHTPINGLNEISYNRHMSPFGDNSNSLEFTFRRACSDEKKKKRFNTFGK